MPGSDAPKRIRSVALGLDLGQASDYAALAGVERIQVGGAPPEFNARGVKRYLLGTSYPAIVADVHRMLARPEMSEAVLVVDAMGCGAPVVDMFREKGLSPVAVKVHGGSEETRDADTGEYRIPKRNLVSGLIVVFQERRIHIAEGTPHIEDVKSELTQYRVKYSASGHDSYEAWREGDHDDLVFALGLGIWWLLRGVQGGVRVVRRSAGGAGRSDASGGSDGSGRSGGRGSGCAVRRRDAGPARW